MRVIRPPQRVVLLVLVASVLVAGVGCLAPKSGSSLAANSPRRAERPDAGTQPVPTPRPPSLPAPPANEPDAGTVEAAAPSSRAEAEDADAGIAATPALELPPPPDRIGASTRNRTLDFRSGNPLLSVRLMEGGKEVVFSPRGRMRMRLEGSVEKTIEAPGGSPYRVRVTRSSPAVVDTHVQLVELRFNDTQGLSRAIADWTQRGVKTRVRTLGTVYGLSGKVIDNRKQLLLVDELFTHDAATQKQAELLQRHGARTQLFEELREPATGILEVLSPEGAVLALAENVLHAETLDGSGFDVRQVEYGVGYDFHGFQDRSFRGELMLAVDRNGALAVVNRVNLEELLMGLVPSEIFSRAHPEALKAQAVTARGEILAKVGTRHLADPYLLCSEQHCAVYSGRTGEAASTNAAVNATRGESLFAKDGKLVDSVYSAVCGGHTENNEVVWGGVPDPSLRGRPDMLSTRRNLPTPRKSLKRFLCQELPAACRLSTFAQPSKFRWERRFTAAEVDALTEHLGIGPVRALTVGERGVSGRAKALNLSGEQGATQVRGELNIRRLFKMLNSAMFEIDVERDATTGKPLSFLFRGGGWGHGVGLCQTGAIGRAEAGQDYRAILRHYFNGAEVSPLY